MDGCRAIYISGLPGTGKSHTVRAVLGELQRNPPRGSCTPQAVFLSCFGLADPSGVHAALYQACLNTVAGEAL